jgi:hypothetical protein
LDRLTCPCAVSLFACDAAPLRVESRFGLSPILLQENGLTHLQPAALSLRCSSSEHAEPPSRLWYAGLQRGTVLRLAAQPAIAPTPLCGDKIGAISSARIS